jgi:hypothetical protein
MSTRAGQPAVKHAAIAIALLVAGCLASVALPASAQESPETERTMVAGAEAPPAREPEAVPPHPWATFVYQTPAPTYRLRLAAEQLTMQAMAFTGYLIQAPPPAVEGIPPISVWDKIRFAPGSWYFDADAITTNFAGHPAAGTFYYMFARANRVSVPEAFLWAVGASTFWELVEFKEPVSINDMIVTPVAGLAIGEAFTQLSAWFDRSSATGISKALAWLFNPMKKLHDWIDGVTPLRDPAYLGWHEFRVGAGAGVLWQAGQAYPAVDFDIATRIVHVPGYGEAGGGGFGFVDGNVSAIGLTGTLAAGRSVDFLFDTETALLGYYTREVRGDGEDLSGWDLFVGGTAGFEYGSHVWDIAGDGPKNQIAMVRFPGFDGRIRLFAGRLEVDCSLDVALDFAGVEPLGAPGPDSLPPGQAFPTVYTVQGYYYALGLHLAPALEVRYGPAALGASLRSDQFWGLTGPFVPAPDGQVISLSDARTVVRAWLRFRVPDPHLEFALGGVWRDRSGTTGYQTVSQQERSLLASFAVVF